MTGFLYFVSIFLIAFGIGMAIHGAWSLWCNSKTYRHRMTALDTIRGMPYDSYLRQDILDALERVTYDEHLNSLRWFKDPAPLYPEPARTMMQRIINA